MVKGSGSQRHEKDSSPISALPSHLDKPLGLTEANLKISPSTWCFIHPQTFVNFYVLNVAQDEKWSKWWKRPRNVVKISAGAGMEFDLIWKITCYRATTEAWPDHAPQQQKPSLAETHTTTRHASPACSATAWQLSPGQPHYKEWWKVIRPLSPVPSHSSLVPTKGKPHRDFQTGMEAKTRYGSHLHLKRHQQLSGHKE